MKALSIVAVFYDPVFHNNVTREDPIAKALPKSASGRKLSVFLWSVNVPFGRGAAS